MDFNITIRQALLVNKAKEAALEQTAGAGLLLHCGRANTYLLKYEHSLGDAHA